MIGMYTCISRQKYCFVSFFSPLNLTNTKYIWSSVKGREVKSDKNKSFSDEKNKTHLFLKSLDFLCFSIENKKPDQKNWKPLRWTQQQINDQMAN